MIPQRDERGAAIYRTTTSPPGVCDHCGGEGEIWEPCRKPGHDDFCPGRECKNTIPCLNCDGTGVAA